MKSLIKSAFYSSVVFSGALALAPLANANPYNITMSIPHVLSPTAGFSTLVNDVDKNNVGTLFGNGDSNWFNYLVSNVDTYNNNIPGTLPDPIGPNPGATHTDPPGAVDITGYDYALLHFGKGNGGIGGGGGLQVWYLDGMSGLFDFTAITKGPNGLGGLSFVRLYGEGVPDGGVTLVLLGTSLVALFAFRRKTAPTSA